MKDLRISNLLILAAGYFIYTEKGRQIAISKFKQFGEAADGAFNYAIKSIKGKNIPAKSFTDIKNTPTETPAAAVIVENKDKKEV